MSPLKIGQNIVLKDWLGNIAQRKKKKIKK